MDISTRHIDLVRAVNESTTEVEHSRSTAYLDGFRNCIEVGGGNLWRLLIAADLHYLDQGIDRPMCCGLWLDWRPATQPTIDANDDARR